MVASMASMTITTINSTNVKALVFLFDFILFIYKLVEVNIFFISKSDRPLLYTLTSSIADLE
jgi:hypothetical protein